MVFNFYRTFQSRLIIEDFEEFWPEWTRNDTIKWIELILQKGKTKKARDLPDNIRQCIEKLLSKHAKGKKVDIVDKETIFRIPVILKQHCSENQNIIDDICKEIEALELKTWKTLKPWESESQKRDATERESKQSV